MGVANEHRIDFLDARLLQKGQPKIASRIEARLPAIRRCRIGIAGARVIQESMSTRRLQDQRETRASVNIGDLETSEDEFTGPGVIGGFRNVSGEYEQAQSR